MRVGGDVDGLQGDDHLHEAIGVVVAGRHRQLLGRHAAPAAGDDPGRLAHVPAQAEVAVVDELLVGVPRNVEVNAHGLEELRPVHVGGWRIARVELRRVVVDDDLPVRVRLWQDVLQPEEVGLPEVLEPVPAPGHAGGALGSTATTVTGVELELAVDAWIALRRAEVMARLRSRRCVEDVAVDEEKLRLEVLVLHAAAPVLRREDPLVIVPGVVDLLVPSLDVAHAAVVVVAQDTPPLKL
mmetsp:Transcript_13044/g.37162  ORF Transcript_13044/g.37162 Transcript_13044/m.37162 type:complete len:240 (-) Transcript_13044:668-1387(-)